jgi:hypothetical protein
MREQKTYQSNNRNNSPSAFKKQETPLTLNDGINGEQPRPDSIKRQIRQRLRIEYVRLREYKSGEDYSGTDDLNYHAHDGTLLSVRRRQAGYGASRPGTHMSLFFSSEVYQKTHKKGRKNEKQRTTRTRAYECVRMRTNALILCFVTDSMYRKAKNVQTEFP